MKKMILVLVLVLVLLLGTILVANAKGLIKVTGGMHYPYGAGRGQVELNIRIDPATYEMTGFVKYRSYDNEGNPKEFGGWNGLPICGDYKLTEDGKPAVSIVLQLKDSTYWPNDYYVKFNVIDGGQNSQQDLAGLVVFPPVDNQPSCEFEDALDIPGFTWFGVGGNVMIHD